MKYWADLTPQQKQAIEKAYRSGSEPAEIAPRYGVTPKAISDQAHRKNWPKPRRRPLKRKPAVAKKKTAKKKAAKKKKKARAQRR